MGGGYYLISGKQIKESELASVLGEGYFFVKPTDGMGGNGIFTITVSNGTIKCDNKPVKQLPIEINRNYIIQRALVQRPDIAAINSSSINTLRIVTQNFRSQPKICACVMRIGRNGSFVDNSAQGGLSIKIDVETGMMNDYAVGEHVDGNYYKHPDSEFVFKGYKITGWDKIKESLLDYVSRVRDIPEIAWDVAVVEDGIEIIEMNINYGIDHRQTSCGGMRRALSIYPI